MSKPKSPYGAGIFNRSGGVVEAGIAVSSGAVIGDVAVVAGGVAVGNEVLFGDVVVVGARVAEAEVGQAGVVEAEVITM